MKILAVALDLKDDNEIILKRALSLLSLNQTILIVHVVHVDSIGEAMHQLDFKVNEKNVNDKLNGYVDYLKKEGVNVLSEIIYSSSVSSGILIDVCDNYEIYILVCGHHTNHELFHRSKSVNIVKHIKCDVFVVKLP